MSQKEKKELAITIGLLAVFAIVLATSFKPKKHARKPPPHPAAAAASSSAAAPPPLPAAVPQRRKPRLNAALSAKQAERAKQDWGRDPFFSSYSAVSLKGGNLSLKGIAFSSGRPAALINTNVVFIGDKVGRAKVIDIKRNEVFLEEGGRKFILRLEENK